MERVEKKFWQVGPCQLGGLFLLIFSAVVGAADLEVTDARLRLLPGDLPAGGYFSLSNVSKQSVILVGAQSAAFERAMMHQSTEKDGMAGMEPVLQLEVGPGETVDFAPGGYHLMLMKRLVPLAIGERVNITLLFAEGARLPVTFQVV
ncbi:Copper chaperone PCu(A)C [compost metagenome]